MSASVLHRHGAALAVLLLALSVSTPTALAQDYEPTSTDWQGLSRFVALASAQGAELRATETLDWEEVTSDDVIVVVYPQDALTPESFASFVVDGGRLLLADDFGGGAALMERLSLRRVEPRVGALPHRRFVDGQSDWPRHSARGRHPLLEGVSEVVSNVPAVLLNEGGPVLSFDEGGGLVYDMTLGEGRAIVLSDPSVLINSMLTIADNARLASNAIDYLCEPAGESCRVWLVHGAFEQQGRYQAPGANALTGDDLVSKVDAFNERVREVLDELAKTELLYFLGLLLALGSAAYLATVLPWQRSRRLSEFVQRERSELAPPQTEFDWNVARFSRGRRGINYALPVAILKEVFEEIFLDDLGLWPSTSKQRPPIAELARRFEQKHCTRLAAPERERRRAYVLELLSHLAAAPTRHRVFLENDANYSARDLARLHRQAHEILGWMGKEADYERRTRQHRSSRHQRPPGGDLR
ncbi:DUF4350 domain-containing protein [Lujinxingia vulgaris]|uniref:DUF4350 domain-containing protein n=1 Tax=Lujinxingia vulgaris TaxID=2600176 RepID=A0A5C6XKH7_9DELT|nr:DUF4350 domain-containing protein [Lujinxingia vulgaris]TXD37816.1 DUF4350 domain-containing protein [Lujinxingia vulgaris]